ncbi:unnamed protein product [Acanthosepion pharaonis]|uniref:Uncharacterized protein n=1 Tax=Acanthosepion pharaonis TaxID=158019 RepID=A0A812B2Z7_ACAPH|nr:unnamed protein product [Sepia pharaonis]
MSGVPCKLLCHTNHVSLTCLFLLLMYCGCTGAGHSVTPASNRNSLHSNNTHSSTTVLPQGSTTTSGCDKNSSSCNNNTNIHTSKYHNIMRQIQNNKGMLLRTLYVLIGVTSVVVIYFAVKAVRLRRRRSKSKNLSNRGISPTEMSNEEVLPKNKSLKKKM